METGEQVAGKYRIERELGRGSLGPVYLARDLRLGRDVALELSSGEAPAAAEREARALAGVSHPNLVVVHEVGEHGGRLFVATEHVAGGDAGDWLAARPRTWREIVTLFAAAGDALAAAHRAGVVHRGVAAAGVRIGADGRPRLAGFALGGGAGDATDDQRDFCALVWEALHGKRPVSGRSAPRHVDAALRRGLSVDRTRRWPAMAPLVAALRRDPAVRWRRAGLAALAVGGIAGVLVAGRAGTAADPCAGGSAVLAATWSPARGHAVQQGLRDPARPWSSGIAARVGGALDGWAGGWRTSYRAVCEAGGAAWSPALRDRGMACLARAQVALDATAELLAHADADTATRADDLVAALPAPARCADPAFVASSAPPPPADPEVASAVAVQDAALARGDALVIAQRFDDAQVAADAVVAAAGRLDHPPLLARARVLRGRVLMVREDFAGALAELREAYFASRQNGNLEGAARAAGTAADALVALSRIEEAASWARLGVADAELTSDRALRATLLGVLAGVHEVGGDAVQARPIADEAVALARAIGDQAGIADALKILAYVQIAQGERDAALATVDEAIGLTTAAFGAEHHGLIGLLGARCIVLKDMGRADEAIAAGQRAVTLAERLFGPESASVASALGNLTGALVRADRVDDALANIARSIALSRRLHGPESNEVASDLNNRALELGRLDRIDEAVADWQEARRIWSKNNGPGYLWVGVADANTADAYWRAGRAREAVAAADRAVPIFEALGDTYALSYALLPRGSSRLVLLDVAGARADLERALALRSGADADPYLRGLVELSLASTVAAQGDQRRARELAGACLVHAEEGQAPSLADDCRKLIASFDRPR